MRRFLNNLLRDVRTAGTARGGRQAPRGAALQVEGLEDRLVMTTASLSGSILLINNLAQNHVLTLEEVQSSNGFRGLEVFDNNTLVANPNTLNISAITSVNIHVAGGDQVLVNDSFGMPFAQGTTVTLFGSGAANSLTLTGSRAVSGNETYVAGGASYTPGTIFLDNLKFQLDSSIASVNDFIQLTGTLDVQTSGTSVVLTGSNAVTQTLSGMGFGGGDTLNYSNQATVQLDEYAANASVSLNAIEPDALGNVFMAYLHGTGDKTTVLNTPANEYTTVYTTAAPVPHQASVSVQGNSGPVYVEVNASTQVSVGRPLSNGLFSTKGIQSTVYVAGAASLFVSDSGNTSAPENVTVTESTITGVGLFANSSVTLAYYDVGTLNLVSGQRADSYTVAGSWSGAEFTSKINITDFSQDRFQAYAVVDSSSHLNLQLSNITTQPAASLDVISADGSVGLPGTKSGTVDVYFAGVLGSQIAYSNFDLVYAQG
jgi:hypothetical protein